MPQHKDIVLQQVTQIFKQTPYAALTREHFLDVAALLADIKKYRGVTDCVVSYERTFQLMSRYKGFEFSNLRLSEGDKKDFSAWAAQKDITAFAVVEHLTGSGFKFSISWVSDQNAFCVTIVGTDATKNHQNMGMTSWSDELEEAILIAGYKHIVLCDDGEWPTANTSQNWG